MTDALYPGSTESAHAPPIIPNLGLTGEQVALRDDFVDWIHRNIGKFTFKHEALLELEDLIRKATEK